ncbi:hypothetical protein AX14_007147, partial [Amanita brunnescens Koide BX004]
MDEIKKTHRRFYDKQADRAIRARDPDWKKDDRYDVWSWKGRIYVPLVPKLREWAVGHGHHHMMAGHPGVVKTLELITRELWWPNMKKDVENYIKGCHTCQTVKPDRRPKAAPLQPNEIPNEPWEIISIDLIGPLTPSKGKDMILVIVDRFSKKAYFLPTNTTVTSQGVANLYKEHIFKEHGLPKKGFIIWYRGGDLPDGTWEEFDEDFTFQLRDLSGISERTCEDSFFSYSMQDIDELSNELGIPWERSKDTPFSSTPPYLGFIWDLAARTVSLSPQKREKYLATIRNWEAKPRHTLEEVQSLHGKLLHATLVFPMGRAYLTSLEAMLSVFGDSPFVPRAPPRESPADIRWWRHQLANNPQAFTRSVLTPGIVDDPNAFSDASSGFGIAIWIDGHWRAWELQPGWRSEGR